MSKKLKLIQKKEQKTPLPSPITDSLLGSIKNYDDYMLEGDYICSDAIRGRYYKLKKVTNTWHNNTK